MNTDPIYFDSEYGAHLQAQPSQAYVFLTFSHDDYEGKYTLALDGEDIAHLRAKFAAHRERVNGGGNIKAERIVIFGDPYRLTAHDADQIVQLLSDLSSTKEWKQL